MKRLVFTGERLIPGLKNSTFMYGEHILRYLFASQFVRGKVVADVGCGVGYGSKILAENGAKIVYGVDNSEEAINYATLHYNHKKIKYEVADVSFLNIHSQSVDIVVAYELIEHLKDPTDFLKEVKHVLKPDGLFILSTPNVKVYSQVPHINGFHTQEFTREELETKLKAEFKHIKIFNQLSSFASIVTDTKQTEFGSKLIEKNKAEPAYFLAIASKGNLPKKIVFNSTLFSDFNLDSLAKNLNTLQREVIMLNKLLTEIHSSKTWHLLYFYQLIVKRIKQLTNINYWESKFLKILQILLPKGVVNFLDLFYTKFVKLRISSRFFLSQLPYILGKKDNQEKFNVIVFSAVSWNHKFMRPQHLATLFSRAGHKVFYIEPIFNITGNKNLNIDEVEKLAEVKKVAPNIYTVKLASFKRYVIYQDILNDPVSINYLTWSIQSLLEKTCGKKAIFKVDWPFWYGLTKKFDNPVVYDCMDDHSGFWTTTQQIIELEKELISSAQLVLASSDILLKKVKKFNKNSVLVNNACEFEHFNGISSGKNITGSNPRKPTFGYFGSIADWLDDGLVEYIASKRPNWNFTLIGNIDSRAKLNSLRRLKNVKIVSEINYKALPEALNQFSAFFVPFKINKLILATNPVKMYEIFATGRPSVWTNLPEVKKVGNLALTSKDKVSFLANLEKALKENNQTIKQQRIAFARKNTWDDRFLQIEDAIKKYVYPKVSVIILSYNTLKYTKLCLDSVFSNSSWDNLEVVVVDNGSTDGSVELLHHYQKKYEGLKTIFLKNNRGFAGGNNVGIKAATGEYIILLNSDTIVTDDWIRRIIAPLANRKVGLVGPVTNAIGNEAKIKVGYKSTKGISKFAKLLASKNHGKSFEIDNLAFFCVAGRRLLWKKIGPLDERFRLGTFEDDDYCLRTKLAGYKLLCAEDVFIHHFLGKTRENIPEMDYVFESNKKEFEEKWQSVWTPHRYRTAAVAES